MRFVKIGSNGALNLDHVSNVYYRPANGREGFVVDVVYKDGREATALTWYETKEDAEKFIRSIVEQGYGAIL